MQHSGTPEPSAISKNSIAWSLDSLKKSQNQSPVTLDMATYGKSNTSHNQTCSEKKKKMGKQWESEEMGYFDCPSRTGLPQIATLKPSLLWELNLPKLKKKFYHQHIRGFPLVKESPFESQPLPLYLNHDQENYNFMGQTMKETCSSNYQFPQTK